MKDNPFFKPTPLYKEYMLLDLIEKDPNITQRKMSEELDISLSMVNAYLEEYEEKGYLQRKYQSLKVVAYHISKKGIERKKVLNISYLKSSQTLYNSAKQNIESFLQQIIEKGFKKILLYGAGEVAEILLHAILSNQQHDLQVLAIIDDDETKQGNQLINVPIISKEAIQDYQHDGILVSSYTHNKAINKGLRLIDYPSKQILNFFDD